MFQQKSHKPSNKMFLFTAGDEVRSAGGTITCGLTYCELEKLISLMMLA